MLFTLPSLSTLTLVMLDVGKSSELRHEMGIRFIASQEDV